MAAGFVPAIGYEADERSSLGKRGERRRGREKRPECSAAVGVQRSRTAGKAHTGHRKPGCSTDYGNLSVRRKTV